MDEETRSQFIVSLVKALREGGWVGKTHVQKTAYFAQEAGGTDLGLRFVIHHYGPYSFELDSLIQTLDSEGVLQVTPEADGYGYEVSVADAADQPAVDVATDSRANGMAQYFVGLSAGELELLGTAYYVTKRLPRERREDWIREVQLLKPRFSEDDISSALDEVRSIADKLKALP